jgi:hypothetical protein
LDLHVGSLFLKDQFEWPLFDCTITPEDFSKLLCADLGISGEFIPLVSHSIREQVVLARLNFDDSLGPPLYPRNMREDEDEEWEPDLKFLSDQEVDQLLKEEDRNNRFYPINLDGYEDRGNCLAKRRGLEMQSLIF